MVLQMWTEPGCLSPSENHSANWSTRALLSDWVFHVSPRYMLIITVGKRCNPWWLPSVKQSGWWPVLRLSDTGGGIKTGGSLTWRRSHTGKWGHRDWKPGSQSRGFSGSMLLREGKPEVLHRHLPHYPTQCPQCPPPLLRNVHPSISVPQLYP